MTDTPGPAPESGFRIDFIDPLFAIAIHIGFVEGLIQEQWLHNREVPRLIGDYADLLSFAAALWFLALSWVGYHVSIRKRPIVGDVRFILDILLLVLYIFLFLYFRDPSKFAVLLFLVFLLYIWWDFYKTKEYQNEYYGGMQPPFRAYMTSCISGWLYGVPVQNLRGETVTVGWTVFFAVVIPFAFLPAVEADWGKLCFALVLIGAATRYRVDKKVSGVWIWALPFKILMAAAIAFIVLYRTRVLCF